MASIADMIRTGVQTVAAGKPIDSETIGGVEDTSNSSSQVVEDSEYVARAEESTQDSLVLSSEDSEDTQADAPESQESQEATETEEEAKPELSSKEVITITGEDGKKRKVEIDYSDRAAVRKAHELAAGARKWQAERDHSMRSQKALEQKFTELEGRFNFLDKAWKEQGVEGVVDLLEGRRGAFREAAKKQYEKEKFLSEATPAEIKEYERQQKELEIQAQLERERAENAKFREEMQKEREVAEERAMESRIHPVFDKYRFAGKLGDEGDEHVFDEMLWKTAMDRLAPYEEEGVEITPELIDKEFRTVANTIRKRMNLQAVKTAAKVVEQKKQEATENVQAKVRSGYKSGGTKAEANELLANGDIKSLLRGWGKYSSAFGKRK